MDDWRLFAKTVSEADPYGHLLSNHNMVIPWDFAEPRTTHICLQLKEVDEVSRVIREFGKPLMVDECRYEGNIPWEWGNISGWELTDRFWKIVCQGGYASHGETFLDPEDILWWSKGGELHGESPARNSSAGCFWTGENFVAFAAMRRSLSTSPAPAPAYIILISN